MEINVALMVGDIYGKDTDLPEPFDKMAEIFRYGKSADIKTDISISDDIRVKITALSTSRYAEYIQKRIQESRSEGYRASESQIYKDAVRKLFNSHISPFYHFTQLKPRIVLIGQTILFEEIARKMCCVKRTIFDPLVIRFSSFYPGPSMHSGASAGTIGYDLDAPKDLVLLKKILTDEPFLQSVFLSQKDQLENALLALNQQEEFKNRSILIV